MELDGEDDKVVLSFYRFIVLYIIEVEVHRKQSNSSGIHGIEQVAVKISGRIRGIWKQRAICKLLHWITLAHTAASRGGYKRSELSDL